VKILAIEILEGSKVVRYTGLLEKESEWEDPGFTYRQEKVEDKVCRCGHKETEHLPGCVYIVDGCECGGYEDVGTGTGGAVSA